uniref:Uncharacterized protein n=1 Tax=Arundo donax TaxID=35708 RepID=A0A0A9A912_ARUDO
MALLDLVAWAPSHGRWTSADSREIVFVGHASLVTAAMLALSTASRARSLPSTAA